MNKSVKTLLYVIGAVCIVVLATIIIKISWSAMNKDNEETVKYTQEETIIEETTQQVEETTVYVETIPESMPEYESIADAGNVIDRVGNELKILSSDVKFTLQTFVDAMQPGSLEAEFINEDMIQIRRDNDKSTVYISGYHVPGFDKEEILLFDVYDDGTMADYEDWAILDSYLYSIKDVGISETKPLYEELPSDTGYENERGTGTINQSGDKLVLEGYTAIDSRIFDNDDYCDTVLPTTAYMQKFSYLVGDIPNITLKIPDSEAASLDVWNFTNAYAIPLEYDQYRLDRVGDETINDIYYNFIRIAGAGDQREVGDYGKYVMVIHVDGDISYRDFYIHD